ncbi:MAG: hypothetical protein M1839_006289 [Geoglossum umbratile]|nr:MAG: hypothetical protein M1839_006289 [Geoglossum umbratile]
MASIFTYDPDPPRVSSPWATPNALAPRIPAASETALPPPGQSPQPSFLADCGITKLEAEPQEGGTEYKLHLLLRPRRSFTSSSTGIHIVGSQHSKPLNSSSPEAGPVSSVSDGISASNAPSNQSREHRLQQLTTQLLWRLQQSSPYHSYSTNNVVLSTLTGPYPRPSRLLPGIEESRGAYYEIGVSDDGTLVGLTRDEMGESLGTLKIMAASLGCCVEVLRMVIVGECEWTEEMPDPGNRSESGGNQGESVGSPSASTTKQKPTTTQVKHTEELWVAEAIVKPDLKPAAQSTPEQSNVTPARDSLIRPSQVGEGGDLSQEDAWRPTEQIRVSLTGATTSGKSSLLGTITTGTLDNSRGKSRLSLLKHRHELASGVTSSIAQELIGYRATIPQNGSGGVVRTPRANTEVVNYASGNVSSWTDIHASSENGRLVLLSDCAGHPRYRRTTVRGLVGWAPHWVALCVAADESDDSAGRNGTISSARDVAGVAGVGLDLTEAHLGLCLKLSLPLVVIVTKLDLASKTGLKNTLTKVLSTLKAAGRKPIILPAGGPQNDGDVDTNSISNEDASDVEKAVAEIRSDQSGAVVPIVLTSAVKGIGIGKVHALLNGLPIPENPVQTTLRGLVGKAPVVQHQPSKLFHIEEIFAFPKSQMPIKNEGAEPEDTSPVLSGHLRYGQVSLGEELVLGPFETRLGSEGSYPLDSQQAAGTNPSLSRDAHRHGAADPSALAGMPRPPSTNLTRLPAPPIQLDSADLEVEWVSVRVISIRNLRLPVRRLLAGQTGTIGVVYSSVDDGLALNRNIPGLADHSGPTAAGSPTLTGKNTTLRPDDRVVRIPASKGGEASALSSSPGTSSTSNLKIRKGMVLAGYENTNEALVSYSSFVARFPSEVEPLSVTAGALVVVYIASVRASARVVHLTRPSPPPSHPTPDHSGNDDMFGFDDGGNSGESSVAGGSLATTEVLFQFVSSREWAELGCEVLVMPGGGPGLYGSSERGEKGVGGLEGFVGVIVEVID